MSIHELLVESRIMRHFSIDGVAGHIVPSGVFRLQGVSENQAEVLRQKLFTDPLTQKSTLNPKNQDGNGIFKLEVGYKPGVMDPAEASIRKAAHDLGVDPEAVSASVLYTFSQPLTREAEQKVTKQLVSQVEQIITQKPETLTITSVAGSVDQIPLRSLPAHELEKISKERSLFLNLTEMQVIQDYFRQMNREPTDVELEMLAQTWSEHNGHKTFKARLRDEQGNIYKPLMKMLKETSERYFDHVGVVSAFADNAGGLRFYDGTVILIKGETHNSPVAVEPYGGALTKNGGVYRDIAGFGKGGENVVSLMVNCFADPRTPSSKIPDGVLHPRYLLMHNSRGERDYGNRMGIPTHGISLHFDQRFGPKPTSLGIAVGIIPEQYVQKEKPQAGDLLVSVGGKTGRDGIHGATFSSGIMTSDTSNVHATAVQIGNAIEEKRMFDALLICRDHGLIRSITDCGGGGYSSAIGEIAEETGVTVNLDKVPQKYAGLTPWEIWLSESQERMIVAVDPKNWAEFAEICNQYDAPATAIGEFTGDQMITLTAGGQVVANLSMEFLHHGLPQREMLMRYIPHPEENQLPAPPANWQEIYGQVLGHLNIASTEIFQRQYDHTVQGRSVLAPFTGVYEDCPNDVSVIKPLYGQPFGIVTAHGLNPVLNDIDPYWGSVWAFTQALSRFVAVGGDPNAAAINDNFVSPFPDPETLGNLHRSMSALADMMNLLHVPCVSGKDSLSSTFKTADGEVIKIPPVLNLTVFGRIADAEQTVSADIKEASSLLVLVGQPDWNNLGGSVYFETQGVKNSHIPHVDLAALVPVLTTMHRAITSGRVNSCKAIGEGGIATALAQMCFGGNVGAFIDSGKFESVRADIGFFNETTGCFLVEVPTLEDASTLFEGVPHQLIGITTEEPKISLGHGISRYFSIPLEELKQAWQAPFKEILDVS
jgi:phosphoribosylformylglycinamidine synthase